MMGPPAGLCTRRSCCYSSVIQSCRTVCNPMDCSKPGPLSITAPGACSNSCPSSQWCHPTFASSVFPFSSCLQSFPASGFFLLSQFFFTGGSDSKSVCLQWGRPGFDPWVRKIPREGNGNLLQYWCLENPMDGGGNLVGYRPWGTKESDTTEWLHFHIR